MTQTPNTTPMMAQYLDIKAQHPDALLFYRMGDFYEMFFEDAVAAAEALDIALTKRGKHGDADIPMCGVPHHAAEGYFLTLIRKGFRVAVCEQMETPAEAKKRGYKAVVKREVVRLVTPGTLTEDTLLDARRHNYLAAFHQVRGNGALAWIDISTGAFEVTDCVPARLGPELARLSPSELIIAEAAQSDWLHLEDEFGVTLTPLGAAAFDSTQGEKRLCDLFKVGSLDAFGAFDRADIAAMAAVVDYVDITQRGRVPLIRPPQKAQSTGAMQIDAATRKSLELTHAMQGGRQGSLLQTIDQTVTAAGARLLERRLAAPSCSTDKIFQRQDAVAYFIENKDLRQDIRASLQAAHDIDRALSRLSLGRGGPRDMAGIRNTVEQAQRIDQALPNSLPDELAEARRALAGFDDLLELLDSALIAEPPLLARDGGFVAAGHDAALDEARKLRDEGRSVIAGLQADYAAATGIASLKIKHNNVLGYFIETTATHAERMMAPPLNETFIHRQTTANQVRFTTVDLSDLETRILNAGGQALDIEKHIFSVLCDAILQQSGPLGALAQALATLDVAAGLAQLAARDDWVRPIVDESRDFTVTGGRHPVVAAALAKDGAPFIANDCDLTNDHIWLLTGPNMAGKSTFLRQNALLAILAQIGSYVPAKEARIGIVSQIFSRVGASDDLARGRSTFMVEMVETAAILNQADDRALVILDEIGRGTATYDGLSIAWATLEHLHQVNGCRALFATHYHEMTQLSDKLEGVANATVAVKEWDGDVIFLHEVQRGTADRSYGVQVARLAGLPQSVVDRARVVLEALEKGDRAGTGGAKAIIDDLPLFSATAAIQPAPQKTSLVEDKLKQVLPDALTPQDALNLIYDLRKMIDR